MTNCKCGAKIIWLKTKIGKSIPVNYHEDIAKEENFNYCNPKMIAHFTTCPHAEKFRKKKICQ